MWTQELKWMIPKDEKNYIKKLADTWKTLKRVKLGENVTKPMWVIGVELPFRNWTVDELDSQGTKDSKQRMSDVIRLATPISKIQCLADIWERLPPKQSYNLLLLFLCQNRSCWRRNSGRSLQPHSIICSKERTWLVFGEFLYKMK